MRLGALVLLLLLPGACGYSTRSLLPGGAQRVAVDVFGNEEYYRGLGIQLSRELSRELNQRSHYRISRRPEAELLLSGRIVKVKRPTLVEGDDNLVSEQAVVVTAQVELRRLADDVVISGFQIANRAEFVVERGETLESAFDEALRDLAEDIVNELERQSYLEDLERVRAEEAAAGAPTESAPEQP
ncbi:MAG: hypothetical protein H6807_13015 [Planctomycetes bacterium]|nr:hypothetical protein [Planctomycetota bacterium]